MITNCPADSKRADVGSGYRPLCDAVNAFVALSKLPADIQSVVQYWDEGDGYKPHLCSKSVFAN